LDITHFFQSIPDKLGKISVPNHILESITVLGVPIILIALSLFISSLALLLLVLSHYRSKHSIEPFESGFQPNDIIE
jgi:NADH:ubiquinone oxidoreductase subunit 3 (subunit A)